MRPLLSAVRFISTLMGDRRGATAVEYGFLLALVVLIMFIGFQQFAEAAIRIWVRVADVVVSHNPNV